MPASESCVQEMFNLGSCSLESARLSLSSITLDKFMRLNPKMPITLAEQPLAARSVSPLSCSPQPVRTCNQHTGISSEWRCDSENWCFHKRHPMCKPPSPGQGHQGYESESSVGEDVRETIFLIFWINKPMCYNVPLVHKRLPS